MRNIAIFILLGISINLSGQEVFNSNVKKSQKYSQDSELRVIYKDSSDKKSINKEPAYFVNGILIDKEIGIKTLNPNNIDSIEVEKEKFELNGKEYYGKIYVKMKSDYNPITLKKLTEKYLKLNGNPIIYQIDEKVVENSSNEIFIDENFILKIVVEKINTSKNNTEINLIRLITKTPENIKKANEIRIKGIENIKPVANNGYK